ncbi:MAG: DUF4277 domain-containing protein [bacterium]|nr:DUF4277 domain-containing protein [bacterium]
MAPWYASQKSKEFAERVRVTERKNLGRIPIVLPLLKLLGFRGIVDKHVPMKRQRELTHSAALEALVAHIVDSLGKKRAPLYRMEEWADRSGMAFSYGVAAEHFNDDRMGDALDVFLPPAEEVLQEISLNLVSRFEPVAGGVHQRYC